jgi:hypothetical protein
MTQIIAIVASIFNILSGATYFRQVLRNESTPNPATWLIWLIVTIMNTVSYFFVVQGNFWISFASIVLACEIFIIFILSLWKGKFTKLGKVEIISLALALLIGIYWQVTGNTTASNLALQVIFLISFYPTIYGLLYKSAAEKSTPWFLAVVSYSLQIINVLLNPVSLLGLAFPIINLIGNGAIGVLAFRQNTLK